jgi:hypothetical protein
MGRIHLPSRSVQSGQASGEGQLDLAPTGGAGHDPVRPTSGQCMEGHAQELTKAGHVCPMNHMHYTRSNLTSVPATPHFKSCHYPDTKPGHPYVYGGRPRRANISSSQTPVWGMSYDSSSRQVTCSILGPRLHSSSRAIRNTNGRQLTD